jgi:murein L,D-transpeptidase YafK
MTPVKSYWAAFGKGHNKGDKRSKGDKKTPEGEFFICSMNHSKRFYKFMGISYPGVRHAEEGLRRGLITASEYRDIRQAIEESRQPPWETRLGGAIGIHGRTLDTAIKRVPNPPNWTDGCIALNNMDVDEVFSVASVGTPVTILP